MEADHGIFQIKLEELNQNYFQMKKHISNCQNANQDEIFNEIEKVKDEIKEYDRLLQVRINKSRSQAVSQLAAVQLDYSEKTKDLLRMNSLSSEESAALFAEFALDFASQATRNALLAALYAINIQLKEEEKIIEEKRKEEN